MTKNPRLFFWFIVILTIFAIIIDLPKVFTIDIETQNIPLVNRKISIHRTIGGFNPNFFIGPWHVKKDLSFRKGLDLEGGTSITLRADMKDIPSSQRQQALESAQSVIERRVNFFGVSEPIVQTATGNNDYRIIVEIPGVSDVDQAIRLIGTTAQLSFWEEVASGSAQEATPSALPLGITEIFGGNSKKTELTGNDLQQTAVTFDPNTGVPQVQLVFSSEGTKKFSDITRRNINKRVAIVLDNQVIEAPVVRQAITTGDAVISGSFTTDTAKALNIQLNAGALPVPLIVLEQHTIGATLGEESLRKSLFAGFIGLLIIVVFMSIYYGRLGMLASFALVLYTLFLLAIFKLIPVTLTLAGIAGFILSIGMAVDANILIFERMREELRRGRSQTVAIELGFSRAWTSIRDSNVSSIITSLILIYFGTGIVRGFAVTLLIGVLVSMFSAIVVTRTFLRLLYKT
ncbi:MAG: protein translocase subunit SecD [Candidatus Levybacteria bacterium]|nr:protein translocase subunit SecD [Candidatus Levybacteria bacterium]